MLRPVSETKLKALMVAGFAGDSRAYRAGLTLCAHRLRSFFKRRLPPGNADVEDLVQETLMAIHHKRASYSPALPFSAWLYGIARYRLIDHFRREGRKATVPLDDTDLAEAARDDEILARVDVDNLLAELPSREAQAIRLTRLDGLSTREAALRSGQSEPAVKVNVHRGLARLMAQIGVKR